MRFLNTICFVILFFIFVSPSAPASAQNDSAPPTAKPIRILTKNKRHLLVDHGNNVLKVWDLERHRLAWTNHTDDVSEHILVDPAGAFIAAIQHKNSLVSFEPVTGKKIWEIDIEEQNKTIDTISLSPQGKYLMARYSRISLNMEAAPVYRVWNSKTGEQILAFRGVEDGQISSNDKFVAIAHKAKNVEYVFGQENGSVTKITTTHEKADKFKGLFDGPAAESVEIWSLENGKRLQSLTGHPFEDIQVLMIDPLSRYIVAFTRQPRAFTVWDLATGKQTVSVTVKGYQPRDLDQLFAIDPSGTFLSYIPDSESVRFWQLADGKEYRLQAGQSQDAATFERIEAVDEPGEIKAIGHSDVSIWDLASSSRQWLFRPPHAGADIIIATKKNALTRYRHGIFTYDLQTGKLLFALLGHNDRPSDVIPWPGCPLGTALISHDQNGVLNLWDGESGTLMATNALPPDPSSFVAQVQRAGNFIITKKGERNLIWDIESDISYEIQYIPDASTWVMAQANSERNLQHDLIAAANASGSHAPANIPELASQLLDVLAKESNPAERLYIAQALANLLKSSPDSSWVQETMRSIENNLHCSELLIVLGARGDGDTVSIIAPFLRHRDPQFSLAAEEALRRLLTHDYIAFLKVMAQHGPLDLQERALNELGVSADERAFSFLVDVLKAAPAPKRNYNEQPFRKKVAMVLGKNPIEQAFQALQTATKSDHAPVREAGIAGLGFSKNPGAYTTIMETLERAKGPDASWEDLLNDRKRTHIPHVLQAIQSFGDLGDNQATPFVKQIFLHHSKVSSLSDLQKECITALGKIGSKEAAALLVEEIRKCDSGVPNELSSALASAKDNINTDTLREIISHGSLWPRRHAMKLFSKIAPEEAAKLASGYIHDEQLRLTAWEALKTIDSRLFREFLWPEIQKLPLPARYYIAEQIILSSLAPHIVQSDRGKLSVPRQSINLLKDLNLSRAERDGLEIAGELAVEHGDKEMSMTLLLELSQDPSLPDAILAKLIPLLGEAEDPRAVFYLAGLMYNQKDQKVRENAARALGEIDADKSIAILQDGVQNADASVRQAAIVGIGQRNDPCFTPLLIKALVDQDPKVKRIARGNIIRSNDPDMLDLLFSELESENTKLRVDVIEILGSIGDQRARPILENLAENITEEHEIQGAAKGALRSLKSSSNRRNR